MPSFYLHLYLADGVWYALQTEPTFPVPVAAPATTTVGNALFVLGGRDDHQTYNYVYMLNIGELYSLFTHDELLCLLGVF